MPDIREMLHQAISHKARLDSSKKDVKDNLILIDRKQKELQRLNELSRITNFSCEYLDKLIKEESGKFIKRVNDVLDYGVKTIFYDCNYSIEIRVSDNDKTTIHLVYEDEDGNKVEPDIRNCGGGVRTIAGALLELIFIAHSRVEPIYFVDEGFSQISSAYVPNVMKLFKEMAEKNGFKVVLITHDNRFIPYADTLYEVQDNGTVKSMEVGVELNA